MDAITNFLKQTLGGFSPEKLGWAVLVAALCYVAIRIIMRFVRRAIEKLPLDKALHDFIRAAIRLLLYFLAVLIVADALEIPITSLVALFSVVGLAVSLAIQGLLTNLTSGLTILFSKPFTVGDYVESGATAGTVMGIGLIYSKLTTYDNKVIFVPNSQISAERIVNYTALPNRRVDVKIAASYESSIDEVKAALKAAVDSIPQFLDDPPPFCGVNAYQSSGIEYVARAWARTCDYWDAYYALQEAVKRQFDAAGVSIPFNRVDVRMLDKQKSQ